MTRHVNLNEAIQVKTALKVLSPGMYTIRYLGTRANGSEASNTKHSANIPLALSQAPIHMPGEIEFICPEGVTHQTLSTPGDYLIAHVKRGEAVLAASKYAPKPLAGKVDVQWRIEPLQASPAESSAAATNIPKQPLAHSSKPAKQGTTKESTPKEGLPITLTGHIERRGDVQVSGSAWLGDPKSNARLEGLQIEWAGSEDVELLGACRAGGQTLHAKSGEYLGTRRKAAPITQLALCLSGKNAALYHLDAEAVFSDGSRHALGAKEAVQANAEGHLVAVRVAVIKTTAATAPSQATPSPARSAWLDPQATYITKT